VTLTPPDRFCTCAGLSPRSGSLLPFESEPPSPEHRTLVLHFPDLACELAIFARESRVGVLGALSLDRLLAAVLLDEHQLLSEKAPLHSATAAARRAGVRPGQTIQEARRLLPSLEVHGIKKDLVGAMLHTFAEALHGVGVRHRILVPDSLLLDLPKSEGGEGPLVLQVCERLKELGHRVRAAVADREAVALLLARFGPNPRMVVAPGQEAEALGVFPPELLQRVERSLRRHPGVSLVLAPEIAEELRWDEPIRGPDPLHFALHGLAARAVARLRGRRQEAHEARLLWVSASGEESGMDAALRSPVRRVLELIQAFRFRVDERMLTEGLVLLRLVLDGLEALHEGSGSERERAPLQALVAELTAELGSSRVGLFSPDEGATLPGLRERPTLQVALWPADALAPPTRVLDVPVVVSGKIARGSRVEIGQQTFVVQRVTAVEVQVGTPSPGLDHLLVWLTHGDSGALGWITRDRRLKRALLHGWFT
jgi:hypothetical protein